MNTPEIDQIVEYTKKFIEAATPIAKQAYEIGVMTLRIDAISTVVTCVFFLLVAFFVSRKIAADWTTARALHEKQKSGFRDVTDYLPALGIPHFIGSLVVGATVFITALNLFNVWLWVKLFSPELWLAHMAVQKIVG